MSSGVRYSQAKRKLVVASDRDRASVAGSGIEHLVHFLPAGDREKTTLENVFPLIGLAFSKEGEEDLAERLVSLRALGTVPEFPVKRLSAHTATESAALIQALVDGGVGRLARFSSAITSELALLRRERETLLENYRALEDAFQARN